MKTAIELIREQKKGFLIMSEEEWAKLMIKFARAHTKECKEAMVEEASNSDLNSGQIDRIANTYPEDLIK